MMQFGFSPRLHWFVLVAALFGSGVALANGKAGPPPKTSTGREVTGPGVHPGEYGTHASDTADPGAGSGVSLDSALSAPDSVRGRIPERMGVDSVRGSGSGPTRPTGPVRPTSPREPPEIPDGGRGGSPRPTAPGSPGTPGMPGTPGP